MESAHFSLSPPALSYPGHRRRSPGAWLSSLPLKWSAGYRKPGQGYGGLFLYLLPPPAPRVVPFPHGRRARPSPRLCTTFPGAGRDKTQTECRGWE